MARTLRFVEVSDGKSGSELVVEALPKVSKRVTQYARIPLTREDREELRRVLEEDLRASA